MVGHATLPPWAWRDLDASARDLPSAQEVWDSLGLAQDEGWELVRLDTAPRAVSHGDEHGTMDDSVVVARRHGTAQPSSSASPDSSRCVGKTVRPSSSSATRHMST